MKVIIPGISKPFILLFILLAIWIFDTFSYIAGKLLGKHHFLPSLSPKKTIEGFVGGMASVIVLALVTSYLNDWIYWAHLLVIAVLTALAGRISAPLLAEMGPKKMHRAVPGG